jgi:hypothetical protein
MRDRILFLCVVAANAIFFPRSSVMLAAHDIIDAAVLKHFAVKPDTIAIATFIPIQLGLAAFTIWAGWRFFLRARSGSVLRAEHAFYCGVSALLLLLVLATTALGLILWLYPD